MLDHGSKKKYLGRDALGGVVIRSKRRIVGGKLARAAKRRGFEKKDFFPGVLVGLPGWERAHSQGKITGHESPHAIRYAPSEVNQAYQRLGIERFIRELFEETNVGVEVILTTVTYTHPGTLRLKEIQYKVEAAWQSLSRTLFEAWIHVDDQRANPKVTTGLLVRTPREIWELILRAIKKKK